MAFGKEDPPAAIFSNSSLSEQPASPEKISPPLKSFACIDSLTDRGKINRRTVLSLLTGLAGGLGIFFLRGPSGIAWAQPKDNRVATVTFAEGLLTVTRADGSIKRLAGQGSLPLYEGDKLQTGKVSQGYLVFKDGTRMALNANTTLVISSRKDNKGTIQTIKMVIGEIWAKVANKTDRFEVETPNALAAISGTEFDMKVEQGSTISTLTLGQGAMEFANRSGDEKMDDIPSNRRRRVEAGFQSNVRDQGLPSDPVKVDVDPILRWGRSLNSRMVSGGMEARGGTQPLRKKSGSGCSSSSSGP